MSNNKAQMTNQCPKSKSKRKYDLEERTAKFGEKIIQFAQSLSRDPINDRLIGQLINSGTSIGANYMEADGAESKKDFRHKIGICRKESKETKHWLRMIAKANPSKEGRMPNIMARSPRVHVNIFSNPEAKIVLTFEIIISFVICHLALVI